MFIRSSDGQLLIVSSSDGYCSIVSFSKDELGTPYTKDVNVVMMETEETVINEGIKDTPLEKYQNVDKQTVLQGNNKIAPTKDPVLDKPLETERKEEEKQTADSSEPSTKKRVQLITLSSPKTKKHLNK